MKECKCGKKVSVVVISVGVVIGVWKLWQAVKNYVASKIAETPMPEASVQDVDFKRVNWEGVEYLAKVSVSNPYPTSLPICEISYSLKSDGRYAPTLLFFLCACMYSFFISTVSP